MDVMKVLLKDEWMGPKLGGYLVVLTVVETVYSMGDCLVGLKDVNLDESKVVTMVEQMNDMLV